MITRTVYIAEDGTQFKFEEECMEYESKCARAPFIENGDIELWGKDGAAVDCLDNAYFCRVRSKEAAVALRNWADFEGHASPCGGDIYNGYADEPGVGCFWWDEDTSSWKNVIEVFDFVNTLRAIFN